MSWRPGDLVRLRTDRFDLASMAREDADERFRGWLADPEVMVGLNLPRKRLSHGQAVSFVLGHDNRTSFMLGVTDRASGQRIGFFIVTLQPAHATAETAVVIGDPAFWGQNTVIEARTAILDFLFGTLGMVKVIGRPHGRNVASIFNYKAMGFTCEAVLRQHMRATTGEGRLDQLIFGLLASEWRQG